MSEFDYLLDENLPEGHRSGVVAVIGRPNVGKSTLINRILNQKIAIVTPKPQTTRKQQLGILTRQSGQLLLVDTPGLHEPHHKLGDYMNQVATDALRDADVVLWVVDVFNEPNDEDRAIAEKLNSLHHRAPLILALNKNDLGDESTRLANANAYAELVSADFTVSISAAHGTGVAELVNLLFEHLPEGPRYYPADQVTEVNMRFLAAEIIREKLLLYTEQEIPYSAAVSIDSFREDEENGAEIDATIYVERDSQKGIVIGKGGRMIKKIGTEARQEMINVFGMHVQLFLHVKVLPNWRSEDNLMRRMGYFIPRD